MEQQQERKKRRFRCPPGVKKWVLRLVLLLLLVNVADTCTVCVRVWRATTRRDVIYIGESDYEHGWYRLIDLGEPYRVVIYSWTSEPETFERAFSRSRYISEGENTFYCRVVPVGTVYGWGEKRVYFYRDDWEVDAQGETVWGSRQDPIMLTMRWNWQTFRWEYAGWDTWPYYSRQGWGG